ncbi:MAG: hypothetical protein ACLSHU_10310 [Oscillospiraceae bacterium]
MALGLAVTMLPLVELVEVLPAPEEIRKLQVGGSGPTLWDGA